MNKAHIVDALKVEELNKVFNLLDGSILASTCYLFIFTSMFLTCHVVNYITRDEKFNNSSFRVIYNIVLVSDQQTLHEN